MQHLRLGSRLRLRIASGVSDIFRVGCNEMAPEECCKTKGSGADMWLPSPKDV